MASKKIIVVFGATGTQGGSVIRSILGDAKLTQQFTIRAITRELGKHSAQSLVARGVEVVSANMDDRMSLISGLTGAYAVFAVTDFWSTLSKETEISQGKNIADAAKETGVEHLIFSSLPNCTELSNGALTGVHHFDSKAIIESYIRSLFLPATFFMAGAYMSVYAQGSIRLDPVTNTYMLFMPISGKIPIPLLDSEDDVGKFVKAILLDRQGTLGKHILGATAYYTGEEIIAEYGKGARYIEISPAMYKDTMMDQGMPEAGAEDLAQMMQLIARYGYFGGSDLKESHAILIDPLTSWKDYVAKSQTYPDLK